MHPFRSLSRIFVPAVLLPSLAFAVPTAVDDSFTTPEDTAAGSAAVNLINAAFDPVFTLPNSWQIIDLSTSAAGGTNTYPVDGDSANWKALGFDTTTSTISGWRAGTLPAQGGGITAFPATVPSTLTGLVPGGPNTVNTYLFRNQFSMTAAQAAYTTWNVSILADDGCIIYINGVEKGRLNYPEGVPVNPDAVVGGTGGVETAYTDGLLDLTGVFSAGQNVVAIELHQNATNSSDAGLDFQMSPADPTLLSGFIGADDAFFGTARANFETQTHSATGGFNGSGALRVQMGNYFGGGGGSSAVSGAWRRAFTLAAAGTVTLSFRHRMISGQDYDTGEYQEVICDVNGTQYGVATAPSTHLAIDFQVGDGNGGGAKDTGWKLRTLDIPLAAGNHTLSLGGYANAGTAGFGGTNESFEIFFDDVSLNIPGTVSLLANDTGGVDPVTAVKASDPVNGAVTINADGSFNYVPDADWFGADTFTYRAVDGTGQSAPATVTVNVTTVNDIPVAVADGPHVTPQGVQLVVDVEESVLLNDSDVETAVLTAVMGTSTGGVTVLNPDGSFTFTPGAGFAGTANFTYRASDGTAQSAPATVTINVTDFPDPPTAVPDTYTAVKNTPLAVTTTTASVVPDDVLPFASAGWHYFDSIVLADRDQGTAWRTDAYTENADWKIGAAELGYDNPPDEVTVIADNVVPGFEAQAQDRFATYYFRRTVDIPDFYNITRFEISVIYDDALAFYLNGNHGGRTANLPDVATLPELAWDFYPNVQINDNSTQTFPLPASALLSGANLIAAEVHQNGPTSGDVSFDLRLRAFRAIPASVLDNDADPDAGQKATLTAEVVDLPAHGTLAMNANGTFTYTPANGYTGPDSFTYRAKDSTNLTSAPATANITVITGPNVAPVANPDSYTIAEDLLLNVKIGGGVLANDTDAESDPFTATIATLPLNGTLTLNPDGSFNYQPDANFNGTDSFTYRAADTRPSAPATVTITVTPVNDAPVAANDAYSGDPGVPFSLTAAQGVLANDSDPDAGTVLTAELVAPPASGTLTLNADGSFTFTVAAGGVYTFTYRAKDATSQSPPATVTIALNAVPSTQADSYTTDEDNPISRAAAQGVLSNDTDPEGQPLTAAIVANVLRGTLTLNADGAFNYVPAANFFGSDSFTYLASDGMRESAPVTVAITVNPVNDPPVALADIYGLRVDTMLTISAASGVLRNDTDVDNSTLTAALVSPPVDGTLALAADGSFTYQPAAGFSGARNFTYRASDGTVQSAVVTVTLNVTTDLNTVTINEIMYNPPGATGEQEEFIEIFNYGDAAVDLGGWEFTKGVDYVFEPGTLIPGQGYLAVPADSSAFAARYPGVTNVTPTGWGPGSSLGNGGENIRLKNPAGDDVDEVEYSDQGDWAVRKIVNVWRATNTPGAAPPPVGNLGTNPGLEWQTAADPDPELGNPGGSSIQLVNPALSNDAGANWSAAAPTPGAANGAVVQTNSAPLIRDVSHSPAVPNATQQVYVTARIEDELLSGYTASVFHRAWLPAGATTAWEEVPMDDNGLRGDGAANDGVFGAVIPAQALNTVVEFYVRAADPATNARTWPAPTLDLNGANPQQNANCLYQVNEEVWSDHRPLYQVVMTPADNTSWNAGRADSQSNVAPNCTVIFRQGGNFAVRYLAGIRTRGNSSRNDNPVNLRLDVPGDNPWNDRTAFTLNYKYSYSQFLASRLYEAAGVPCEKAGVTGMRINGVNRILDSANTRARSFGYYCDLIPRGGDTINEWFPGNDDGNSYGKIRAGFNGTRWAVSTLPTIGPAGYAVGGYVNEGYTKQTNAAQNDWTDLHAWMQSLQAGTSETFHTAIAGTVDIDEWCRFLAVSTIVNHGETNMANGDDDDYSVYFGATDKLARIIPHDLDTCFNLNAIGLGDEQAPPTVTIYQCTDPTYIDNATLPQMDKFYRNPVTGRKFKAALRRYLDTLFAKPAFDATVDQLLDSQWMGIQFTPNGDAIRTHIKTFLDTRRATIETFLPTAFTAATTLTVQDGLPRSTSATDLGALGGKIDPARTAEVKVNGVKVTTNPYGSTGADDNSWSAGAAVTLTPGINTLVCTAHDESGAVFATQTITIWHDAPGINTGGTLAASETWTPAAGPYNVATTLTVPSGMVLTIEPGTTVFLASGADINVSAGGRLQAVGTAAAGITLTRIPSGTGTWGGITISGATSEPSRISHATFNNNGDTAVHAQSGANVELTHLTFLNPGERFIEVDESSFLISDCVFPSSTAAFEPVYGSGGIAPGGRGVIQDCWFGKTMGYSDSIDFTGGNRPGPVLHVLRCVFTGSDDDILDLDSTDAWVEGNVFMHAHRNGSPDSASGVSGGADNADYSQVTVINNLFYDCDNAVTMKQGNNRPNGNSAVLLYNTIVHTTKVGGTDTGPGGANIGTGVVNFDDDNVDGEGKGMYLEGNIIWDAESLTRNYDPALSQLTLVNNILPVAPPAGATASGNVVIDPMLNLALITTPGTATAGQVIAALRPQNCSPALASGPFGGNKGADLSRRGIRVQTPPTMAWPANVTLNAGPGGSFTPTSQAAWSYGFTHYKYRLDSGIESAEIPVSTPLTLTGLASGQHTLAVSGKDDSGVWQEGSFGATFMVVPDAPAIALSEIVAAPATGLDWIELHNYGTTTASLAGCTLFAQDGLPAKLAFAAGASIPAGGRLLVDTTQLGFNLNRGGETITLSSPSSGVVDSVTFGPQVTGLSIARVGSAWMLSIPTPGTPNTAVCVLGAGTSLHINEWSGSNDIIVSGDFVELYNGEPNPVSIAGWSLSQDFRNEPGQNVFPPLSFIGAGGFLELVADGDSAAGADHLNFKVSRIHDSLALVNPAGQTADTVHVLPGNPDVSQGRTTDGSAVTGYLPLPTPGFSNGSNLTADSALMNGLRITELMFDPPGSAQAEYIELKNISAAPLTITGVNFDSGITFTFPALTLEPGAYTVITNDLARFHAPSQFPGVPAVQWTGGRLDNNGETIRMETAAFGLGILDFRYEGDWYPETRTGAALEIIDPAAPRGTWGDKASWQPGVSSPGGPSAFGVLAPPDVTVLMPGPAILHGFVSAGTHAPGAITVAWSKVGGPGTVNFTAPANKDTDATFTAPGTYELRLTATPPGGAPDASDTVIVNVAESYDSWAARTLAGYSAAQKVETADADNDGIANLIEHVLGTDPASASAGPELIIYGGHLALRYNVSKLADPAIQVIPQITGASGTWQDGSAVINDFLSTESATTWTRIAEDTGALGASGRKLLRLKIVSP